MPRVSILLTCYNHIRYLPACLDSIEQQTYKDFEIIAIDDGSEDGTRDYLGQRTDLKVILNEENIGTYGSLNKALEQAQGEFIAVMNDDDMWGPEKLQKQVEFMDSHPEIGLCHTDGGFIDQDGLAIEGSPLGFEFPRTETGDVMLALMYANKIIASAVLARTATIRELGGFDSSYYGSGDWHMWIRMAEHSPVGYIDERLTFYRVHGANASHRLERIWGDDLQLRTWLAQREDVLEQKGYSEEEIKGAMAHNWACLGTIKTLLGDPESGRDAYKKSLEIMPGRLKSRVRLLATYLPTRIFRRMI